MVWLQIFQCLWVECEGSSHNIQLLKMGSPYSKLMKDIPKSVNKEFPSVKAAAVIKSDAEGVQRGRENYAYMKERGTISLCKNRWISVERHLLSNFIDFIKKEWKIDETLSLNILHKTVTSQDWEFSTNTVEELEASHDGTSYFYCVVHNHHNGKLSVAVCYMNAATYLGAPTLIGGLISEGILTKDDEDKLYLNI